VTSVTRFRTRVGYITVGVLLTNALLTASFQILAPVVPVLVERSGPEGAAGGATAALFITMVAGELAVPWLHSRWSPSQLLIGGQAIVAVTSLAYLSPRAHPLILLAATSARGLALGAVIVICVLLATELAPPERQGRALGLVGTATGVPGIVFPSLGIWMLEAGHPSYAALLGTFSAALGMLISIALPPMAPAIGAGGSNLLTALRRPMMLGLFASLALFSFTNGGVLTFVPVNLHGAGLSSAAIFFLVLGISRIVSRFLSGVLGDRYSSLTILLIGLPLASVGLAALAVSLEPVVAVFSAITYGLGYGAVQTAAYLLMKTRAVPMSGSMLSTLWNSAIDVGSGSGGALVGVSASVYGYSEAFWLMPVMASAAAVPLLAIASRPSLGREATPVDVI